jgi:hypothetical protein
MENAALWPVDASKTAHNVKFPNFMASLIQNKKGVWQTMQLGRAIEGKKGCGSEDNCSVMNDDG